MGTIILKYPEDPTGVNPNNLVINEPHDLGPARNRAFVPNYGSYFTESMIVTEVATGRVLTKGTHYIAAQLQQDATLAMNKEICAVVVITDEDVQDSLLFTYQVVGGVFSTSAGALAKLIEALDIDEREVEWGGLIGIPTAFPPTPHLHDIGDIYGFEYLVEALDALRNAILIGDEAAHDELRQYINYQDSLNQVGIEDLRADFEAHENNKANPHDVTKLQVGLGNVNDWPIASPTESQAGTVTNKYMTPFLTAAAITTQALGPLNIHIANQANPHGTTKAQVGLPLVENYQTATQAEAEAGVRSDRYLTPLTVKQAITAQALSALSSHTSNVSNPHATTKLQVGLGNVLDYGIASQTEAQAGTVNIKYMTPLTTAQAITTQALAPLNTHIANVSNPHATTKAQVGLGSVDNYPTATTAEATGAGLNNRFMTPLTSAQLIDARAIAPLNTHIANQSNPHGTTKAQVGLGNVQDLPLATSADAIAGGINTKYMTPLTVAQAIEAQALVYLNAHLLNVNNPHSTTKAQVGLSAIPNAITSARNQQTDGVLLTARSMFDHVASGDHDSRYAPKATAGIDSSVLWDGAGVYIWGGGAWRKVWPAQWA